MRSTFPRTTVFLLAALLAIFGFLVTLCARGLKNPPPTPEPVTAEAAVSQPTKTKPILVEAFLPLGSGCMGPMVEHLNALEKKYAGRIKVVYTDFSQPEGLKAMEARGLHCLTIMVNGADRFTVKNPDGTERETWFNKPPEAGNWKLEDLDQVVARRVEIQSGLKEGQTEVIYQDRSTTTGIFGVTPSWASVWDWDAAKGEFIYDDDIANLNRVCVLGPTVRKELFGEINPKG